MPKVTIASNSKFDKNAPCIELLKQNGFEVSLTSNDAFSQGLTGDDDVIEKLNDSDAVIAYGEYYTSKVLDNLPQLKVIARLGVGFDKIDMESATRNSVAVTITPNGNHQSVAEHAITLMMSLARNIPLANTSTHKGKWEKSFFTGTEIYSKTLGMIGCGNIGSIVADRAKGLKMKVKVYDPFLTKKRADEIGVERLDLDELLKSSDFLTLHVPLNKKTIR